MKARVSVNHLYKLMPSGARAAGAVSVLFQKPMFAEDGALVGYKSLNKADIGGVLSGKSDPHVIDVLLEGPDLTPSNITCLVQSDGPVNVRVEYLAE